MYNRYIGNTGKFYRIDDDNLPAQDARQFPAQQSEQRPDTHAHASPQHTPHPKGSSPFSFSQQDLIGGLKGLVSNVLPDGMDIGDLLLILVLLLLYLEKEDEEILIILSVLLFMGFK